MRGTSGSPKSIAHPIAPTSDAQGAGPPPRDDQSAAGAALSIPRPNEGSRTLSRLSRLAQAIGLKKSEPEVSQGAEHAVPQAQTGPQPQPAPYAAGESPIEKMGDVMFVLQRKLNAGEQARLASTSRTIHNRTQAGAVRARAEWEALFPAVDAACALVEEDLRESLDALATNGTSPVGLDEQLLHLGRFSEATWAIRNDPSPSFRQSRLAQIGLYSIPRPDAQQMQAIIANCESGELIRVELFTGQLDAVEARWNIGKRSQLPLSEAGKLLFTAMYEHSRGNTEKSQEALQKAYAALAPKTDKTPSLQLTEGGPRIAWGFGEEGRYLLEALAWLNQPNESFAFFRFLVEKHGKRALEYLWSPALDKMPWAQILRSHVQGRAAQAKLQVTESGGVKEFL